jgi:hypothetical protein
MAGWTYTGPSLRAAAASDTPEALTAAPDAGVRIMSSISVSPARADTRVNGRILILPTLPETGINKTYV